MADVRYITEDEARANTESVVDKFAEVAAAGAEATATLKALCEVMHVDEAALKEKMVINALKEKRTIGPSFENDVLEVIERLIAERDEFKRQRDKLSRDCDERYDAYRREKDLRIKLDRKIASAVHGLENSSAILGCFVHKRKYTEDDMNRAQLKVYDQFQLNNKLIIKILTEDFEE